METDEQNEDFQKLHQLIRSTEDVRGFLQGMTSYAARTLSRATGVRIECAVTLHRRRRRVTIAGSSETATALDRIEQELGEGPCLEALQTERPVVLPDTDDDRRWPEYSKSLTAAGAHSVLGVPLDLGNDSAALNFFAPAAETFTEAAVQEAVVFADMAGQALSLAVRISTADLVIAELKEALETRSVISMACGIIMEQDNCSQEQAFTVLTSASQNRNEKLRDLAEEIVKKKTPGTEPVTRFDG